MEARFDPTGIFRHRVGTRTSTGVADHSSSTTASSPGPLGLTTLNEPSGAPAAHIVFVHGFGGDSRRTWSGGSDPQDDVWPLWLSTDGETSQAKISTFGFNAGFPLSSTIDSLARALLASLGAAPYRKQESSNEHVPLIFIAHSLGGAIVQKAWLLSQPDSASNSIRKAFYAVLFFACPQEGITPQLLRGILSASGHQVPRTQIHGFLSEISESTAWFRVREYPVPIYSFFETLPTPLGRERALVIPKENAVLNIPGELCFPVDADHHGIVKFKTADDGTYLAVQKILRKLIFQISKAQTPHGEEKTHDELYQAIQYLRHSSTNRVDILRVLQDVRTPGTCQWLWEKPAFSSWLHGDSSEPCILWCYAPPGCGKSVSCAFIIERLLAQNLNCLFYFFQSGTRHTRELSAFLLSIASQLLLYSPDYSRLVSQLAADDIPLNHDNSNLLFRRLFKSLLPSISLREPIYLVVDGIDEAESVTDLLQLIGAFVDLNVPLRLLLLSREHSAIEKHLRQLELPTKRAHVLKLSLQDNAQDIHLFVKDHIGGLPLGDPDELHSLEERVLRMARSNFLWVRLVMQELQHCYSSSGIDKVLQRVPLALDSLYDQMSDTIKSTSSG